MPKLSRSRGNGYSLLIRARVRSPFDAVDHCGLAFGLRRKFEVQAFHKPGSIRWRECVLVLEPSEFRLDDKVTGQTAASTYWEMTDYGRASAPHRDHRGSAKRSSSAGWEIFSTFLRHLQEQYFAVVRPCVREDDFGGCFACWFLCRSMRASYVKTKDADLLPAPAA